MRVDIQIAQSSNYLFKNTSQGDVIFKTMNSNVGVHFGAASTASNALLSVTKHAFLFGGNNSNVSVSNNILQVGSINFTGALTQNGTPFVSGGGSVTGLSNLSYATSNTMTFHIASNTSNDSFMWLAGTTSNQIMKLSGLGALAISSNDSLLSPGYTWQGDTQTGIYHVAAGQIGITSLGSNIVTMCNTMISVNTNLQVGAPLNLQGLRIKRRVGNSSALNVSVQPQFMYTGCNVYIGLSSNLGIGTALPTEALEVVGRIALSNSGGRAVLASSNNNLGINKSNPSYALDVNGDLNFTGALRQNGATYQGSQWSTVGSNVVVISSNVGIGLSNPSFRLDVSGDINLTGTLRQNGSVFSTGIGWQGTTSNIYTSSNIGVGLSNPQYPIHVTNSSNSISIYATGDIVGLSDERLKTNFSVIGDAIDKVKRLNGYTFQYRSDPASNVRAGLIAQEVMEVFPEVVSQDNMGYYNLAYGNMAALILNAIKELDARLEKIESRP